LLLLYLLFVIDCCIIIIFYPRQSLFSEHTRIQHVTPVVSRRNAFIAILVPKLVAMVTSLCPLCTTVLQMASWFIQPFRTIHHQRHRQTRQIDRTDSGPIGQSELFYKRSPKNGQYQQQETQTILFGRCNLFVVAVVSNWPVSTADIAIQRIGVTDQYAGICFHDFNKK